MTRVSKTSHTQNERLIESEPIYKPPSTGVLSLFSDRWRPYAELARLDKPGFALLWIVHFYGILRASILNDHRLSRVLWLAVYFILPFQVLMLFNFAWNDTCDVKFDRQVLRTRHRPLARNALTLSQALAFDCFLAFLLLACLAPLPRSCAVYAVPLGCGCIVYPLTKRFTNHPQACLGFILAGGVYMGAAAAGVDALPYPTQLNDAISPQTWWTPSEKNMIILCGTYLTVVVWVISTEIVYSYQDAEWDEAAGVGTITRLISNHTSAKILLSVLAGIQVFTIGLVDQALESQRLLCITRIGSAAATLGFVIKKVDLSSPEKLPLLVPSGQYDDRFSDVIRCLGNVLSTDKIHVNLICWIAGVVWGWPDANDYSRYSTPYEVYVQPVPLLYS